MSLEADSARDGPRLRTARLELVASTGALACADAARDYATLSRLLTATIPADWPPALTLDVLDFFAQTLTAHPEQVGWWGWFIVRTGTTPAERVLIGGIGFKGPPTPEGTVEMGYSVLPAFERHGYATEAARALMGWVFADTRVARVVAETLPDGIASQRVLVKLGLQLAGPGCEAGTLQFKLDRADYRTQ